MAFGGDPRLTHEAVARCARVTRLPVIPKLSPNVADIRVLASACEEAAPTRSPAINTLLGLAVDVERAGRSSARDRRPVGAGDPPDRAAHGLAGCARGADPGDRHRRHRLRRGRARVPDRGLPRRAGRHRQFRGSARSTNGCSRASRLSRAARASRTSTRWWGRWSFRAKRGWCETGGSRVNARDRLIVALDVRRPQTPTSGGTAGRRGRHAQGREPALHRGRPRLRARAGRTRREGLPRPQVPRHPEHRGARRERRLPARRLAARRPRAGRPRDARGGGRGAARDGEPGCWRSRSSPATTRRASRRSAWAADCRLRSGDWRASPSRPAWTAWWPRPTR